MCEPLTIICFAFLIRNYSAKGKGVEDLPDRLAEGKYGI